MKAIVCHMSSAHPANDIRIFHKQCASLVQQGFEVHLVAAGNLAPDNKGVTHHSLPVRTKGGRLGRMLFRVWQTWRLAKQSQASLFHFHDPELLPYGLLLKWQGKIVIYDAHEDLPRDIMTKNWIPHPARRSLSWLTEKVENGIARRLDTVVAATPFIRERFEAAGARAVDVKNYPMIDELKPAANATPTTQRSICYLGAIGIQRGILDMLKAVEDLPLRLIIAGNFMDAQSESLARSSPGWAKVDFRGQVSRAEVAGILAESELGLCLLHPIPTFRESLPIKLFEYMSAGIPVLSSTIPLWQEIVDKAQCGLCVDPQNAAAIREAILWVMDNPREAKAMGLRGMEAVQRKYSWDVEAGRLIGVYEDLLR